MSEVLYLPNAKNILSKLEIKRNTPILSKKLITLLNKYVEFDRIQLSLSAKVGERWEAIYFL